MSILRNVCVIFSLCARWGTCVSSKKTIVWYLSACRLEQWYTHSHTAVTWWELCLPFTVIPNVSVLLAGRFDLRTVVASSQGQGEWVHQRRNHWGRVSYLLSPPVSASRACQLVAIRRTLPWAAAGQVEGPGTTWTQSASAHLPSPSPLHICQVPAPGLGRPVDLGGVRSGASRRWWFIHGERRGRDRASASWLTAGLASETWPRAWALEDPRSFTENCAWSARLIMHRWGFLLC